jgi:hypothetical protein
MTSWRNPILLCVSLGVFVPSCGGHLGDQGTGQEDAADDGAGGYGGGIASLGASVPAVDATVAATPTGADAQDPGDAAAAPPFDAGPQGVCENPLAPGDLLIDELMIESISGTGDHGEWLEVSSTLDCAIDIVGLHGECPRGAKAATFDVTGDLWIPARGTFLVADSSDPAINHYLPGSVVAWSGHLGDVLRNKGTTITLRMLDVIIDTLTYPAVTLTVGASLAFPADCDSSMRSRSDWTLWQTSSASWFPGFLGTPNAPNVDVTCPPVGDP